MDIATAIEMLARLERMADELDDSGVGITVEVTLDTRVSLTDRLARNVTTLKGNGS